MKSQYEKLSLPISNFIDDYADKALEIIDDEEKLLLQSSPEEELTFYHFTLGIYLRCRFNLWKENGLILQKIQNKFSHPDEIYTLIIYRMWQKLKASTRNNST